MPSFKKFGSTPYSRQTCLITLVLFLLLRPTQSPSKPTTLDFKFSHIDDSLSYFVGCFCHFKVFKVTHDVLASGTPRPKTLVLTSSDSILNLICLGIILRLRDFVGTEDAFTVFIFFGHPNKEESINLESLLFNEENITLESIFEMIKCRTWHWLKAKLKGFGESLFDSTVEPLYCA